MPPLLQVAIGGAAGASLRYLVVEMAVRRLGPDFPWGTVVVNLLGSFVMGLLAVTLTPREGFTPLLMAGLLGGFTTYSAFSLDTFALLERGEYAWAAGYVALTLAGAIGGCIAGVALARGIFA